MDNIKLLGRLGMTEYEARAYLALASLGPSKVSEIVADSKLPRNKAYEALQGLEQKNHVTSLPVSPRRYKINNPGLLKEQLDDMHESVDSIIKLVEQPKTKAFKDIFWVIQGRRAIIEKLREENKKHHKEILSCSVLDRMLYKNIAVIEQAVKRGAKVKFIAKFDKKNTNVYKAWMKAGAEIRVFNTKKFGPLIPRISIFDGESARVTVGRPEVLTEEEYITLWTESKAFANMLRNQFMTMWRQCEPIEKHVR